MNKPRLSGFTLVEMIITIVLLGIISVILAVVIRSPIDSYFNTVRRSDMVDTVDNAMRRMSREIQSALPNSIHLPGGANRCVQFIPAEGGGRYRAERTALSSTDILDFSVADNRFDVLGSIGLPPSTGTHHVVVYNTGISPTEAYGGLNRAAITAASSSVVQISATKFPLESPSRRFHVIPDNSVVYSCENGNLVRSTSGLAKLAACPTVGAELIPATATCFFGYNGAFYERNGLLYATIVHTRDGESIRAYRETHVYNVP